MGGGGGGKAGAAGGGGRVVSLVSAVGLDTCLAEQLPGGIKALRGCGE